MLRRSYTAHGRPWSHFAIDVREVHTVLVIPNCQGTWGEGISPTPHPPTHSLLRQSEVLGIIESRGIVGIVLYCASGGGQDIGRIRIGLTEIIVEGHVPKRQAASA